MATIVTQSHAPWWGNLAAGVLGTLINNMIADSRQNNQTAKQNALLTEASKINDVNAQTSGFSGNAFNSGTNNLLGDIVNANAPTLADNQAGYNFHPSGLTPTSPYRGGEYAYQQAGYNNLNYGTPAVNNGLTLNKIMQALANDPTRFRSVNMADMAKLAEPYIAGAQALRDKTERENLANTIYQDGKFNPEQLAMMYLRGLIGDNAYNNINAQYTMTPQQQAELNYRNAKLAQDARQFDANLRYNYYNTDTGNAFNYERLGQDAEQFGAKLGENARQFNAAHELNKQNADTNETAIIVTNDGETYRVNKRTGETTSVKDPKTGETLTQAVKTEEPKSAVEEIKTLLQARQEAKDRYINEYRTIQEEGTGDTARSQNILKQCLSDIWQYDWQINELRASYSNNPKFKDTRHKLLQYAVDHGLELPAGVDASLYTRAEGTAEEVQAVSQANAKGAVKVTSDRDVEQINQPSSNSRTATRGDPVAAYQKQLQTQAQANADANKPISSVNGQQPASTDVTGGNPNGTTSSVNNNSAAKVTPPDDLIYDPINNRGKKAISSATYDNLYAMAQNGELKAQGINSVQELLNNMRAFGIRVVKN